jgi:hypothetical protein
MLDVCCSFSVCDLFNSHEHSDITIKLNDTCVPAHKLVLCKASKQWENALSSTSELHVDESEKDFLNLLRLVYGLKVTLEPENAFKILGLAHKYELNLPIEQHLCKISSYEFKVLAEQVDLSVFPVNSFVSLFSRDDLPLQEMDVVSFVKKYLNYGHNDVSQQKIKGVIRFPYIIASDIWRDSEMRSLMNDEQYIEFLESKLGRECIRRTFIDQQYRIRYPVERITKEEEKSSDNENSEGGIPATVLPPSPRSDKITRKTRPRKSGSKRQLNSDVGMPNRDGVPPKPFETNSENSSDEKISPFKFNSPQEFSLASTSKPFGFSTTDNNTSPQNTPPSGFSFGSSSSPSNTGSFSFGAFSSTTAEDTPSTEQKPFVFGNDNKKQKSSSDENIEFKESDDGSVTVDDSVDDNLFHEYFFDFVTQKSEVRAGEPITPVSANASTMTFDFHFEEVAPSLHPNDQQEENGETDEEALGEYVIKLFEFENIAFDKSRWEERGIGICRILKRKNSDSVRIVVRSEHSFIVWVNCAIFKEMKYEAQSDRFLRIGAIDRLGQPTPLLFKFKQVEERDIAKQLLDKFKTQ